MRHDGLVSDKAAGRGDTLERQDIPDDTDDDQRHRSPVEKLINALDEVQEAVARLAAEKRTAGRRIAQDLALLEPFSREDSSR